MASGRALENWLTKPLAKPEEQKSRSQSVSGDAEVEVLPTSDILCSHGGLDPRKASNMKRVSRVSEHPRRTLSFTKHSLTQKAYEKLSLREDIGPVRSPREVCEICVRESFIGELHCHVARCQLILALAERRYQIVHPRLVTQFDEICDVQQGEPGYWISKAWLKGIPIYFIILVHVIHRTFTRACGMRRLESSEAKDACSTAW